MNHLGLEGSFWNRVLEHYSERWYVSPPKGSQHQYQFTCWCNELCIHVVDLIGEEIISADWPNWTLSFWITNYIINQLQSFWPISEPILARVRGKGSYFDASPAIEMPKNGSARGKQCHNFCTNISFLNDFLYDLFLLGITFLVAEVKNPQPTKKIVNKPSI